MMHRVFSIDFTSIGIVAGGMALGAVALFQGESPPADATGVLSGIIQGLALALSAGGVGTYLIKTAGTEYGKQKESERTREVEERARERAENERQWQFFVTQIADRDKAYLEQIAREREAAAAEIAYLRKVCETERSGRDTLVLQFIEKIQCGGSTPAPSSPAVGPKSVPVEKSESA